MRRKNQNLILKKLKELKRGRSFSSSLNASSEGNEWPKQQSASPRRVQPFILTCGKRLATFRRFVSSYEEIAHCMEPPVLIVRDAPSKSKKAYHKLLLKLKPSFVIEQPRYHDNEYKNLQKFMVEDFPRWALQFSKADIIFIEDDAIFSKRFPSLLMQASAAIRNEVDFLTFFSQKAYPVSSKHKPLDIAYPINGVHYYGNICVLFARRVLEDLYVNYQELYKYPEGWDIRWGCYMEAKGYRLYRSKEHTVDHLIGPSAITGKMKRERNESFTP